jgi:hypothetical protein
MSTRGDDVELMRATQKLIDVEGRLSRRGARSFGAHAGEKSRSSRPYARSFSLFGGENAAQQRHGGMMITVSVVEFVQEIVTPSLVNASGQLA